MGESLILLVRSGRNVVTLNDSVLRRRGKSLEVVASGSEALLSIQRQRPSLVVFGNDLQDMSGPEFCREIRGNPLLRSTSLLRIADSDDRDEAELCLAAGCNDILFRPFLLQELDARICRLSEIPIRKQVRTLVKMQVNLETEERATLGHSLNVSASGILVQTAGPLPHDRLLRLQFYLHSDPLPMFADSRLVRAEFTGGTPRYGFRFENLPDSERERLGSFIQGLRSGERM